MALCKALQQSEGEFKLFQLVCDCVLLAAQCAIQFSSEPNLLLLVAALFVEFIQYSFLNRSRHVMVVTSVLSLYTIYTQKTLHYDLSLVLKVQSFFVILQFPRDTSSQRSQQRHLNQALYVLQTYFRISRYSQVPIKQVGPNKRVGWKMKKVGPNKRVGWKIC